MHKLFAYKNVERATAALLTAGMLVVIGLAIVHFFIGAYRSVTDFDAQFQYSAFQNLFDRLLAALIALELAHTVHQMAIGRHGLTQVRTVLLIGLLAAVRKFVLLDVSTTTGVFLTGLGAAIFALAVAYSLILWVEDITKAKPPPSPGHPD